jgi:hypothetical protein
MHDFLILAVSAGMRLNGYAACRGRTSTSIVGILLFPATKPFKPKPIECEQPGER